MYARLRTLLGTFRAHPVRGAVAICAILLCGLYVAVPLPAFAQSASSAVENAIVQILGHILGFFTYVFGQILIKFIDILITVAQFNNFIDAPAVKTGWAITRDMANMFFIIGLLVMAIGTVFRIQEYRYNRLLQKFIIMAVLINFSKSIAGFFIDLSQVVMLTFVNAFKGMAAGNLATGFGIENILSLSSNASAAGGDINFLSVVGALFAAFIMVFIATVVVGIFVVVLLQRIIMLWIYVVLSPTAYMVAILPGSLGSWWNSWWRDFSSYLIKGPVIAFFLWLALTVISLSNQALLIPVTEVRDTSSQLGVTGTQAPETGSVAAFASEATTAASIINYFVAVGMLIAGLQQAMKVGGAAGAVAGKWMGNFNKWGSAAARSPVSLGKYALKRPAYDAAGAVLGGASKIPLVGGTFGKLNARLTRQRLKSEEKDSDWINYADEKTVQRLATSSFAPTENARRDQKIARERMLKNNEVKNLDPGQQQQVLQSYRKDIGYREVERGHGDFRTTAVDASGAKLLDEAIRKNPALLGADYGAVAGGVKSSRRVWLDSEMTKLAKKMTIEDIAKSDPKSWDHTNPANAAWLAAALPVMESRFGTGGSPADDLKRRAPDSVKDVLRDAMTHGGYSVAFQEDIDQERQERTARRMRQYDERGLKFHESKEYLDNRGQYYDLDTFTGNTEQAARRIEREQLKKQGVLLPVTGASGFASGAEDTVGVSEDVLNEAGIKLGAGGTVISEEDKLKLAAALDTKLTQDIREVERQLAESPRELLDGVQEGSGTGTTVREAMQMKLKNLQGVQARIQDVDQLGSVSFVNADRYGGRARNIKAEEDFHRQLQAMDPDGSFRKEIWDGMSGDEQQQIVAQMRAKTGRGEDMGEAEALEEYLAKGLTNLTRETWADKSPDAVKLQSGLALAIQAQAEKQGVKMWKLGLLTPEVDTFLPSKVSPTAAAAKAKGRAAVGAVGDATRGAAATVAGAASAAGRAATAPVRAAVGAVGDATRGAAAAVAGAASAAGRVATAPVRAAQRVVERRAEAKAEAARSEIPTSQLNARVTEEVLKDKQKSLREFEKQSQQDIGQWNAEYQEAEQTMQSTRSAIVARRSAEKMNEVRGLIKQRGKDLETRRKDVQDYDSMLKRAKEGLGSKVSTAFGKGTPVADGAPAPAQSQRQAPTTPRPSAPATPSRPSAPAPAARVEAAASAAESEPRATVVNQNVTQNIQQVFNSAPDAVRGQLGAINGSYIDNAFRNSFMWKGLLKLVKDNISELQKSEKMSDLGRAELTKRIGNLDKHVQDENLEGFKQEFGELKSMFGAGSAEE